MSFVHGANDNSGVSQSSISLDAWADLIFNLRSSRAALFGADLFNDPAWDIILLLGREGHVDGLPLEAIASRLGRSEDSTRRWLQILVSRGHLEVSAALDYKLGPTARNGLFKIAAQGAISNA